MWPVILEKANFLSETGLKHRLTKGVIVVDEPVLRFRDLAIAVTDISISIPASKTSREFFYSIFLERQKVIFEIICEKTLLAATCYITQVNYEKDRLRMVFNIPGSLSVITIPIKKSNKKKTKARRKIK